VTIFETVFTIMSVALVGGVFLACGLLREIREALYDVRAAIKNLNIAVNTASDPREFGRELNKVLRRAR